MIRKILNFLNYLTLFITTMMFVSSTSLPGLSGEPTATRTNSPPTWDADADNDADPDKESGTPKIAVVRHDARFPFFVH